MGGENKILSSLLLVNKLNMARKLTQKEIEDNIKSVILELDNIELISISYYNSIISTANTQITLKCLVHNKLFTVGYSSLVNSSKKSHAIGCHKCHGLSISKSKRVPPDEVIKEVKQHIDRANSLGGRFRIFRS